PGPWTVRQIVPDGWTSTSPMSYLVQPDQTSYIQGFGSIPMGSAIPTGSISVFVFDDSNGNGLQDANETPRKNTVVYLDLNNNDRLDNEPTTGTSLDGVAQLKNIRPGT